MNTRLGWSGLVAIVSMTLLSPAAHMIAHGAGADAVAAPAQLHGKSSALLTCRPAGRAAAEADASPDGAARSIPRRPRP